VNQSQLPIKVINLDHLGIIAGIIELKVAAKSNEITAIPALLELLDITDSIPTYQRSLRQKMKRTAMDNDYMIQVLSSSFLDSPLDSFHSLCQA
jgi:hypothetical protein